MGVIENLPCDCAALGTIAAIIGLILNTYSYSEVSLADDVYSLECGWEKATYTFQGDTATFSYSQYSDDEQCQVPEAINSRTYDVNVCDSTTFIVGIVYLVCGILGSLITLCSVSSQAPKFAARS